MRLCRLCAISDIDAPCNSWHWTTEKGKRFYPLCSCCVRCDPLVRESNLDKSISLSVPSVLAVQVPTNTQNSYDAWPCANQHREWNLSYVCMNHSWMRTFLQPSRPDLRVTQHCCGTLLYVFDTANVEHSLQILASLICLIYFIQLGYGRGPYCRRFESDFFQLLDVPNSRICFGPKTWTYTSWSVHTLCRYRNEKCVDCRIPLTVYNFDAVSVLIVVTILCCEQTLSHSLLQSIVKLIFESYIHEIMSSVRSFRHRWALQQLILDHRERKTSLSALFSQSVLSTDKNMWHMRHGPAQTSTENEICPTYAWITVGWEPSCNRHVRTFALLSTVAVRCSMCLILQM